MLARPLQQQQQPPPPQGREQVGQEREPGRGDPQGPPQILQRSLDQDELGLELEGDGQQDVEGGGSEIPIGDNGLFPAQLHAEPPPGAVPVARGAPPAPLGPEIQNAGVPLEQSGEAPPGPGAPIHDQDTLHPQMFLGHPGGHGRGLGGVLGVLGADQGHPIAQGPPQHLLQQRQRRPHGPAGS